LLPGGRPRRFGVVTFIAAIQAGGRPRRRPRPRASRSRLRIASSICSRSWRNSANIFDTSIIAPNHHSIRRRDAPFRIQNRTPVSLKDPTLAFLLQLQGNIKRFVLNSEQKIWGPGILKGNPPAGA
jgi:hypothetical protein